MLASNDSRQEEYVALMSRARSVEHVSHVGWVVAAVAATVLMSWAIGARSAGLMVPVVFAVALGFHSLVRGSEQERLIAGYVEEFLENRDGGPEWFSRLGQLRVVPGFSLANAWIVAGLASAVVAVAIILSWVFAGASERGQLMAGIVTGCGLAFALYAVVETSRLRQTDFAAFWRQVGGGPREVRNKRTALS
jgi:hypothetical protein